MPCNPGSNEPSNTDTDVKPNTVVEREGGEDTSREKSRVERAIVQPDITTYPSQTTEVVPIVTTDLVSSWEPSLVSVPTPVGNERSEIVIDQAKTTLPEVEVVVPTHDAISDVEIHHIPQTDGDPFPVERSVPSHNEVVSVSNVTPLPDSNPTPHLPVLDAATIPDFDVHPLPSSGRGVHSIDVVRTSTTARPANRADKAKSFGKKVNRANNVLAVVDAINWAVDHQEEINTSADFIGEIVPEYLMDIGEGLYNTGAAVVDAIVNGDDRELFEVGLGIVGVPTVAKLADNIVTAITGQEQDIVSDAIDDWLDFGFGKSPTIEVTTTSTTYPVPQYKVTQPDGTTSVQVGIPDIIYNNPALHEAWWDDPSLWGTTVVQQNSREVEADNSMYNGVSAIGHDFVENVSNALGDIGSTIGKWFGLRGVCNG